MERFTLQYVQTRYVEPVKRVLSSLSKRQYEHLMERILQRHSNDSRSTWQRRVYV